MSPSRSAPSCESRTDFFARRLRYALARGPGRRCRMRAEAVVRALRERVARVAARSERVHRPRVLLLEWLDPPFSCGPWSPELSMALASGDEVIGVLRCASRTLTWAEVAAAQPEVVVIACCGFSVERTRHKTCRFYTNLQSGECYQRVLHRSRLRGGRVGVLQPTGSAVGGQPGDSGSRAPPGRSPAPAGASTRAVAPRRTGTTSSYWRFPRGTE